MAEIYQLPESGGNAGMGNIPFSILQGEIGRQMFPLIIQKMCDC